MIDRLFEQYGIKGIAIKNRIVMPPMSCIGWADDDGNVSKKHVLHYEQRAKGGVGLIVVEATSVSKSGKTSNKQLGIWKDEQIEGLKKIVEVCKQNDSRVIIQLVHAGLKTPKSVAQRALGPSKCSLLNEDTKTMSIDEIHKAQYDFVIAAERAFKAGFDGIELHGAHGFLLEQFLIENINRRNDKYGETLFNRLRFVRRIIEGIRAKIGEQFLVSYRMGCNNPTLNEGIRIAKGLESLGTDILHVSASGLSSRELEDPMILSKHMDIIGNIPDVPRGFNYSWIVYGASQIKKHVKIPVIAVDDIRTPKRAATLIESGIADFAAIGKSLLVDAEWANKAKRGETIKQCMKCRPCLRYTKPEWCTV